MESIPDLLAKLKSDLDNERRIERAHGAMLQLAERYRPGAEPFDRLRYGATPQRLTAWLHSFNDSTGD